MSDAAGQDMAALIAAVGGGGAGVGALLVKAFDWLTAGSVRRAAVAKVEAEAAHIRELAWQALVSSGHEEIRALREGVDRLATEAAENRTHRETCERELAAVKAEVARWRPDDPLPAYRPGRRGKRP